MDYLAVGLRSLVAAVFLFSSVSKLAGRAAFREFADSVGDLVPVPAFFRRPVAGFVVAAELAVVLLLVLPWGTPTVPVAGFAVAIGLLLAFTVGIVFAVLRGVRASCRCFGPSQTPLGLRHVIRNVIVMTATLVGAVAAPTAFTSHPAGLLIAVLGGVVVAVLVAVSDDIYALFQPVSRRSDGVPDRRGDIGRRAGYGGPSPHHRRH